MMNQSSVASAVNLALLSAGLAPAGAALAADQTVPQTASTGTATLDEVVITGTHVRRVDAETASPVLTLDSAVIAQSGAVTVGDLISKIPSIAGAATNPQINNGGGTGASTIELRGLGDVRTLVLIDGKRIGAGGAADVNQIPVNLIDHIDVLKEGAGVVYGSDAIAGVVNFITRRNVQGVELTGDWGESSKHDAQHHSVGLLFGGTTDKLNVEMGFNYNQQDELTMGQRAWSKYALYLYSGTFSKGGSSRTPTGRIYPSSSTLAALGCTGTSITRIAGAAGSAITDYRCFQSPADKFNFQPYNLNLTPQERGNIFTKLNYQINDSVEAYMSVLYNRTHSAAQLAPLPFDANADQIIISKDSIYNPFGVDFGGGTLVGGANGDVALRMSALGPRYFDNTTQNLLTYVGVKGKIPSTQWDFDMNVGYNRIDFNNHTTGYLLFDKLQQAVGPSFIDPTTGTPTCGTVAAPIPNCTPANIFNLGAPGQAAALNSFSAAYNVASLNRTKSFNLDMNGPLFKMQGGDALGSVGVSYTDLNGSSVRDTLATATASSGYLNCGLSQETCGGNYAGGYNVKELYAEVFAPVLANVPGVSSLNVDAGIRSSNYSLFGKTTRGQFKIEYRPIHDVLVRGTYVQVFRAPTVGDIAGPSSANSPSLNDLCAGYTGVATAAYPHLPAACVGVPTNGTFAEPQNQVTGLITSNANLKPESGNVETFGIVWDPSQLPGFSITVDYWKYKLNDIITTLDPNYAIRQCAITGAAEFCNLFQRYGAAAGSNAGQVIVAYQPTFNLGQIETDGIDFSVKYTIRNTSVGNFQFTGDVTKLNKYDGIATPGAAVQHVAGTDDKQYGFYAKLRGTFALGWSMGGMDALLSARYIGGVDIPLTNYNGSTYLGWSMPAVTYFDLSAGYLFDKTHTKLTAGIINLADKTPPIGGINSYGSGSSVTDVTVYDTVGRRFFLGFNQKF